MSRAKKRRLSSPPTPAGSPQTRETVIGSRRRRFAALGLGLLLLLLVFATFSGATHNGFVGYDDPGYVTENEMVLKGLTPQTAAWAFTTTHFANWHPLTWLSHMLDVQLFGLDAGAHHGTSVVLHALNALLLLLLLWRMTGALGRGALVAALFAVHPLHVESVAWIAERKDVLSTLFGLLALLAWSSYARSRRPRWYGLSLGLFGLSLMAKPMLVTLPFLLLLLDVWPLGRLALPLRGKAAEVRRLVWEKAPFFVLSAAGSAVTYFAQKSGGALLSSDRLPLAIRAANAVVSYVRYLGKTCWPDSLSVFYPYPPTGVPFWAVAGSAFLLAAVTLFAARFARRAPFFIVGWLWFLGTMVPVIGLVQVGSQSMADRYTYVPLVGLFLAGVWGAAALVEGRRLARAAAVAVSVVLLLVLSVQARRQVGYWKDTVTLFEHAIAATQDNYLAHGTLGIALFDRGEVDRAIAHYQEAVRIDPSDAKTQENLGAALFQKGDVDGALARYQESLRLEPDRAETCAKVATALFRMGRTPEALGYLERATRTAPTSFNGCVSVGIALQDAGRLPEARDDFQRALELRPDSALAMMCMGQVLGRMDRLPEAIVYLRRAAQAEFPPVDAFINLGVALDRTGDSAESIEWLQRALRVDPHSKDALADMGRSLAKRGRVAEAIEYLLRAVESDPRDPQVQFVLGMALAHERRYSEARDHFQEAVRLRPEAAEPRARLQQMDEILRRQPAKR